MGRPRYLEALPAGADLVIVGGGIVGAATAFHASQAGLHTLILERRGSLCSLTTAVAAGGFRLQQDDEEELALARESAVLFLHFAELTGQGDYDPGVQQQGYLWLARTDEVARRQRAIVKAQQSWGLADVDIMTGEEAVRWFPYLGPAVIQARFRAGDGLLDPKALTVGLAAAACARGAAVAVGCEVAGLRPVGERIEVATSWGRLDADAVVVAAGPFSGEVAAMAGLELPVTAVRRHKLVVPDVPDVPPGAPMTIDEDTGAHWRPAFGGAALLFTDPDTPPTPPAEDVPVDHRFAFQLLDPGSPVSVAHVTPFWREVWQHGVAHWFLQAGQYTMTADRRPLIGATPVDHLFANTGYSGHGVMTSPAGSRLLVDLLTGKAAPEANPYRPGRRFDVRPPLHPL
jgi:glycine/D-amino acid oxidase-like deaminating enzyme